MKVVVCVKQVGCFGDEVASLPMVARWTRPLTTR
jgi:hypothetical protein